MDVSQYSLLALRTQADQFLILNRLVDLGPSAMQLDNGARGLCDEVGEVSAVVKKYIEYGQPLDRQNLLEEVGDCLWRLNQICWAAGLTLQEAMDFNLKKLQVRYPERFTDSLAANRNLEAEATVFRTTASPTQRTKQEIGDLRKTVHGCCSRWADNQRCDCLENAK